MNSKQSNCSVRVNEDVVVVGGDTPVFRVVVLIRVVLFVVCEVVVQLETLLKVLSRLQASNVLQEVEVSISVNAGAN